MAIHLLLSACKLDHRMRNQARLNCCLANDQFIRDSEHGFTRSLRILDAVFQSLRLDVTKQLVVSGLTSCFLFAVT